MIFTKEEVWEKMCSPLNLKRGLYNLHIENINNHKLMILRRNQLNVGSKTFLFRVFLNDEVLTQLIPFDNAWEVFQNKKIELILEDL